MQSNVNSGTRRGTHVFFITKYYLNAFLKKARKTTTNIMKLHESKFAPFKVLENKKQFQIILGNAIMSQRTFTRKQDAEAYLASKPYDLVINAACYCMEQNLKIKENEKNHNSTNSTADA